MRQHKKNVIFALCALTVAGGAMSAHWASAKSNHKVTICHGTASAKNPYVLINVDTNALAGHFNGTAPGHGKNNYPDKYPYNGSCEGGPPSDSNPES